MKNPRIFLRAEWRRLLMANYVVDPALLQPHLPPGVALDTWQGKHYVSLVGFLFKDTRVLGVRVPWHVHFPEVNLRFYVRRSHPEGDRRGVSFIQEIVPKPAIAWLANTLYREHYVAQPMDYQWEETAQKLAVHYRWKNSSGWQEMGATASTSAQSLDLTSEAGFILEHYWGYSRYSAQKTIEYQVGHPTWEVYPVQAYQASLDFAAQYGPQWAAALADRQPDSVFLAEGSPIWVGKGDVLRVAV